MKVCYSKQDGLMIIDVTYYPVMVELTIDDKWHETLGTINMSLDEWRTMNDAVEAQHNGEYRD